MAEWVRRAVPYCSEEFISTLWTSAGRFKPQPGDLPHLARSTRDGVELTEDIATRLGCRAIAGPVERRVMGAAALLLSASGRSRSARLIGIRLRVCGFGQNAGRTLFTTVLGCFGERVHSGVGQPELDAAFDREAMERELASLSTATRRDQREDIARRVGDQIEGFVARVEASQNGAAARVLALDRREGTTPFEDIVEVALGVGGSDLALPLGRDIERAFRHRFSLTGGEVGLRQAGALTAQITPDVLERLVQHWTHGGSDLHPLLCHITQESALPVEVSEVDYALQLAREVALCHQGRWT